MLLLYAIMFCLTQKSKSKVLWLVPLWFFANELVSRIVCLTLFINQAVLASDRQPAQAGQGMPAQFCFGLAVAREDLEVPGVPGVQTGFWAGQGERSHVKDEARWPGRRDPGEERQGEPRAQPEDCAPGSPARDQETMVSVSLRRLGAVTAGTSANSIDTRLLNLLDKGCHIILQLEHLLPKSYLAPLQTKSKVCVRGCYVKLYMYICIYMEK